MRIASGTYLKSDELRKLSAPWPQSEVVTMARVFDVSAVASGVCFISDTGARLNGVRTGGSSQDLHIWQRLRVGGPLPRLPEVSLENKVLGPPASLRRHEGTSASKNE